jgi:hypothetical protein
MGMPRAALPRDSSRSEDIIWGMAFALALLFAIGQVLTVLAAAPAAIAFHNEAGGTPWFVEMAAALGPTGLTISLVIIDAAVFALFAWLAKRYWIGFVYLPPLMFLGIGTVAIWMLVANAVSWVILQQR